MNIAEDIYEEVARIYGYDKIDILPMKYEVQDVPYTPLVDLTRKLEDILVRNLALAQTETYPRIGEKILNTFQTDIKTLYSLQNPTDSEMPYLRDTMTYGLLHHIIRNHKFFDECKIFDIGKVWTKGGNIETLKGGKVKKRFANEFVNEQSEL
jgi:phenylalanyl-tRNA synthetase beta chain